MRAALWVAAGLLLAGCASPGADHDAYRLTGSFTQDRTQADFEDFDATLARHGATAAIAESFPEQFFIELPRQPCLALREELVQKDYLQSVSECRRIEQVADPDDPTSGG